MKFRVLGPLAVVDDDGDEVAIGSPKQRVLLASMLAAPGRTVSTDRLVDAIWDHDPPPSAESSLRTHVSRLRTVVGDRVQRRGRGYALVIEDDDIFDAALFEGLRESDDPEDLCAALRLWRGGAFGDLHDLTTVAAEAHRLEELQATVEERRVRLVLDNGELERAVAEAEALVADHPGRESAWVLLIGALVAGGRPGAALGAVRRAASALADLGLEPSETLREAERAATAAAEIERIPDVPSAGDEDLVGRDRDLANVHGLLDEARVVTIHGAAGVGKTRLAHRVAAERAGRHRHGVHLVDLDGVADPAAAPSAILDALGLVDDTGFVADALAGAGGLDALVVLDHGDHVLDAVAEAVEAMVGGGAALTVLVISGRPLEVGDERPWALAPLSVDDVDGPAVQLFVRRAAELLPSMAVGPEDRVMIRRLCANLDGLPSAIELAASRVADMGLRGLSAELGRRLDISPSARRPDDRRRCTLADVVAWSVNLLDDEQRTTLHDLGVFAGPVTAEIAERVIGRPQVADTIRILAERSLLVVEPAVGCTTYQPIGALRRHGRGRLTEADCWPALRRRHLDAMVDLATELDHALRTEDEGDAGRALDGIGAELRAAHEWARGDDPRAAIALSARLHVYAVSRGRSEVRRWAEHLADLVLPGADGATTLATVAVRAADRGRPDLATRTAERSLELAGPDPVARFAHEVLGQVARSRGDLAAAYEHAATVTELGEAADDLRSVAVGRSAMALARSDAGRHDEALEIIDATDISAMSPSGQAWIEYGRAVALAHHDLEQALEAMSSAVSIADAVGERVLAGQAAAALSSLTAWSGPMGADRT